MHNIKDAQVVAVLKPNKVLLVAAIVSPDGVNAAMSKAVLQYKMAMRSSIVDVEQMVSNGWTIQYAEGVAA